MACFLLASMRLPADNVQVEPQSVLQKKVPCRFTMHLEQPADAAYIEFSSGKQEFFLNQKSRLQLNAGENQNVFTAELIPKDIFHPSLRSDN